MPPRLLKEWNFNYHEEEKKVIFDGEKVQTIEGSPKYRPTIKTIKLPTFFTKKAPLGILASIDTEIMLMAVMLIGESQLKNNKAKKVYQFWKHIDLSKIEEQNYHDRYFKHWQLFLTPQGGQEIQVQKGKSGRHIYNQLALDLLFFDGPIQFSLSLEDRISIQKNILNALHPDSGLTLADAFPLFDYEKLTPMEWKVKQENAKLDIEEIVSLTKGKVWTGTWEFWEGRIGGSVTVEHIWKNRKRFRPKKHFKEAYKAIYEQLEGAIISQEELS